MSEARKGYSKEFPRFLASLGMTVERAAKHLEQIRTKTGHLFTVAMANARASVRPLVRAMASPISKGASGGR